MKLLQFNILLSSVVPRDGVEYQNGEIQLKERDERDVASIKMCFGDLQKKHILTAGCCILLITSHYK